MTTKRNTTLDIARGFTVFIMPAVHSLLYYGSEKTRQSRLAKGMAFLAEGPGAQLFLFLMGASIALGRKKNIPAIIKRAAFLMGQSFLLNLLRLFMPYKLGLIPERMLTDAGIPKSSRRCLTLLTLGDILQCASVSYAATALIYTRHRYIRISAWLAFSIVFASPKLWDRGIKYPPLCYLSKLAAGRPPEVFFPLFPWLVYPMAGLCWGGYLKAFPAKQLWRNTLAAGLLITMSGRLIGRFEPPKFKSTFYRLGPGGTLAHLGTVLLWLYFCHAAVRHVKWNPFFQLLARLSRSITPIYFVQWILVIWLLPVFGYRRSGIFRSLVSMMMNTLLTFRITKFKNPLLWKKFMTSRGSVSVRSIWGWRH